MSNVINFDFESNVVRTVEIDGEHHFVLKDVLTAMGSKSRTNDALASINNGLGEGCHNRTMLLGRGGQQEVITINREAVIYLIVVGRTYLSKQAKRLAISQIDDTDKILGAIREFEVPEDIPNMYVYAIREKETRRIKLGISRNPQERLKQLQTGNSQELELVATKKTVNGFEDEALLHKANNQHAIRGEWFNEDVDTQDLVAVQ